MGTAACKAFCPSGFDLPDSGLFCIVLAIIAAPSGRRGEIMLEVTREFTVAFDRRLERAAVPSKERPSTLGLGVNSVLMTDLCLLFNSRTAQSQDVNSPELTPMTDRVDPNDRICSLRS